MDSYLAASAPQLLQALPVVSALLVQLIPSIIIAYVPASSTAARRIALLAVAILAANAVIFMPTVVHNFVWRTTSAALTAILATRSCDVLCLHPVGPNDIAKPSTENGSASGDSIHSSGIFDSSLFLAWRQLWNMRGIGTKWSIRGVTPFDALKPDYVPSQGDFIGGHLVRIAIALVVMDFFAHQAPQNVAINYTFDKQHLAWRLAEVDAEELFLRVAGTVGFWVNMACYISTMYSFLAVVFVGLGLDTPADWPPVFGSISDGWTIQRFWGLTWHQTLRSLLSANCDYLLLSLLRLPRQSMLTRHARLGASFVLSGALHHIVDALVGVPLCESGMFKFFVMQWVGIIIEDVLATLGRVVGEGRPGQKMRYMGYAWVFLWLVWTTPSVFYPYTRAADGIRMDHSMLPRKLLRS
ncbi:hypothetical protein JX265_005062 [Neoarthrinium moseri]|uniref:Wax synthase domain-containing protein n=1 Tax=Neoarthrinium moseri TaxID=1658444 RepID=A0A9P9WP34_9PEZI|nr:hypothetical protein JX265_005062 [Neoarthrinium moseri]